MFYFVTDYSPGPAGMGAPVFVTFSLYDLIAGFESASQNACKA